MPRFLILCLAAPTAACSDDTGDADADEGCGCECPGALAFVENASDVIERRS
jgi:hypothetical protein